MADDSRFDFVCQRSGRCCRIPDGVAFVDEGEIARLALDMALDARAFARSYVRSVVDPRTNQPRLALRDRADGACILLDGDNECRAYRERPQACRDFPFWRDVLGDADGFARATATCPGIVAWPAGAAREAALAELATLMQGAPEPVACVFAGDEAGPFVTGLELERVVEGAALGADPQPRAKQAFTPPCPLERDGQCSAPEHAPLACRNRAASADPKSPVEQSLDALTTARDTLEARLPWPRLQAPLSTLWKRRHASNAAPLAPTASHG